MPQACLVDSRAGVSQRRHCGAAGSHPEGEPPAGSIDPFYCREAEQAVAAALVVAVGLAQPNVELPVVVGIDSGHDFAIGGSPEVEGGPPVCREVVLHVLAASCVLPAGPGFDVGSSKLPGFDSLQTEDVSVNLFE